MPKAKPVSLHPLTFHEALKHFVRVDPDSVGLTSRRCRQTKPTTKPSRATPEAQQDQRNATDHATPAKAISAQKPSNRNAQHDKDEAQTVRIVPPIPAFNNNDNRVRDWLDYILTVLTLALVLITFIQSRLLYWTYIAVHRPRLIIRHIALLTDPEEIMTADEKTGKAKFAGAEFSFMLNNRGSSTSTIIERNITLKPVGRSDNIEDILKSLHRKELSLPPLIKKPASLFTTGAAPYRSACVCVPTKKKRSE